MSDTKTRKEEIQIIEGNKLIAEFMGAERLEWYDCFNNECKGLRINGELYPENRLEYHSSWDWLMPAISKVKEKIKKAGWGTPTEKEARSRLAPILNEVSNNNIENAHYCLAKFIEWYNKTTAEEYLNQKQ